MVSRVKVLMICLSALFALSAAGASVAQAGQPFQPLFTSAGATGVAGETVSSALTVEDQADTSRLWNVAKKFVITCARATSLGKIEPKGRDTGTVTYKECAAYEPVENAAGQWQEGIQYPCEIENLNPVAPKKNEILTRPLKSRLVWGKAGTAGAGKVFEQFEPAEGTVFVEFEFKGVSCVFKTVKVKVEGSVLGWVPTTDQEGIIGAALFEVLNPGGVKEVRQHYTEWEVQEPGAIEQEKGVDELKLKEGEKSSVGALESIVQFELSKRNEKRQLFGVRTK